MKRIAILLAGALAVPAFAQSMLGMAGMPGMAMPSAKKPSVPKPAAKTLPKRTPAKAGPPAPGPAAEDMAAMPGMASPSASADPACPPEHAAMGHCKPAASTPATPAMADMPGMTMPAAAAAPIDPNCPPEHAAAGHCTPAVPAESAPAAIADMPGMAMPPAATPADPDCPPEHAAAGHCTPKPQPAPDPAAAGTALPAGNAAPPPPPAGRAADAFYPPAAMAMADRMMRQEHGGMKFSQIMFNLAEYQARDGRDGYRWDGEGWFGGDIHRFVVKTEGEGARGDTVEDAEVQALYSRAIDPYFNLQAGVRQDLGAGAKRTYAALAIEGLAPYWFEVEGTLFLSSKGDLLGRLEAYYDQRLTQRLILQPRIELNLAVQTVAASRIGAGLSNAELGLRLRYEAAREFAPYVGVSWDRKTGDSARFARADGESASAKAVTLGIRTWF